MKLEIDFRGQKRKNIIESILSWIVKAVVAGYHTNSRNEPNCWVHKMRFVPSVHNAASRMRELFPVTAI